MHRIIAQIGPFTLYSYGLFVAAGFLLSTVMVLRDSRRVGISTEAVSDCLVAVLLGGLVGGRFLFVAVNWQDYSAVPLKALMFYEGGMAYQGALVGAVLAGTIAARWKKISFWKVADVIAPYIALGQAVGRIGCFLNGCCYGRVIESGIGVTFPGETVMRVPTQVYSSLVLLALFAVLLKLGKRKPFGGYVFTMYVMLYAFFRFFMDFARGDLSPVVSGMTLSQLISVGMFVCALILYAALSRPRRDDS